MTGLQPFDPFALVLIALLNPVVALVGFLMGRSADQPQKILVAAFAAALAGSVMIWIVTRLQILPARGSGGEAGLLVLQMLFGLGWAFLGYSLRRKDR
jgi:hypothetical protein